MEKENIYYKTVLEDFRIPVVEQVSALMSFLRTASNKINDEERELIELTIKSCCYMQKMIDMLSDISSFDNKKFKLNYEDFNFCDLINEAISNLSLILKYEKLDIDFKVKENAIAHLDRKRILIAIESLFLNLFNYSNPNTVVYITTKISKNRLYFEIENKGQIIPEIEQEKMFERYKLAPSCYLGKGVDLGMYYTKEIISAHFGQMIIKSNSDGVNIFGFSVPLR